jgi:signal transduction histidine kinase
MRAGAAANAGRVARLIAHRSSSDDARTDSMKQSPEFDAILHYSRIAQPPASVLEPAATCASRPCILVVDDEPYNIDLLEDIFSDDYEVFSANSGIDALEIAARRKPDLILLDVMMPGIDGYEVCRRLKAKPVTQDSLVIFITGMGSVADETRGLEMGAVDYVTKPINPASVKARVDNQIKFRQAQEQLFELAAREHERQIDAELKRSAEIERSAKAELQQKDDFLSHVSHELRSPLTSIYSFSTIIADGLAGETTAEQNGYLEIILKNVDQLQSMIEDLLQVTEAKSGKVKLELQCVSVGEAIVYSLDTLRSAAAAKKIALSFKPCAQLAPAYADPMRLRQVLIVLIDNAIKFTPIGGRITVSAGPWERDPQLLLLEVSDTGCGIDPAIGERIFEHLYQASASDRAGRRGLGLGLHIAKDLVTRQAGEIWVSSEPGLGSRFFFTVPVSPAAA